MSQGQGNAAPEGTPTPHTSFVAGPGATSASQHGVDPSAVAARLHQAAQAGGAEGTTPEGAGTPHSSFCAPTPYTSHASGSGAPAPAGVDPSVLAQQIQQQQQMQQMQQHHQAGAGLGAPEGATTPHSSFCAQPPTPYTSQASGSAGAGMDPALLAQMQQQQMQQMQQMQQQMQQMQQQQQQAGAGQGPPAGSPYPLPMGAGMMPMGGGMMPTMPMGGGIMPPMPMGGAYPSQMPPMWSGGAAYPAMSAGPTKRKCCLLHCKAIKLARMDGMFGRADPFVTVAKDGKLIAKSEIIRNTLNPDWKPFLVDVEECGGMDGRIEVRVYDYDDDGTDDYVGGFATTLNELTKHVKSKIELKNPKKPKSYGPRVNEPQLNALVSMNALTSNRKRGTLIFTKVEQVDENPEGEAYEFAMYAKKIPKMDGLFGKADPFLIFYRLEEGKKPVYITKTEYKKQTLEPHWRSIKVNVSECGGMKGNIVIQVYDYDDDGVHDRIGEIRTTMRELVQQNQLFPILDPFKVGSVGYTNSGTLFIEDARPLAADFEHCTPCKVKLTLAGKKLSNTEFLGKSDPYFVLKNSKGETIVKSETVNNNLSPQWEAVTFESGECGLPSDELVIEVWDWEKKGDDEFMGEVKTCLKELYEYEKNPEFCLFIKDKKKGLLVVNRLDRTPTQAAPSAGANPYGSMFAAPGAVPAGAVPPGAMPYGALPPGMPPYGAMPMQYPYPAPGMAPYASAQMMPNAYAPPGAYPQYPGQPAGGAPGQGGQQGQQGQGLPQYAQMGPPPGTLPPGTGAAPPPSDPSHPSQGAAEAGGGAEGQ